MMQYIRSLLILIVIITQILNFLILPKDILSDEKCSIQHTDLLLTQNNYLVPDALTKKEDTKDSVNISVKNKYFQIITVENFNFSLTELSNLYDHNISPFKLVVIQSINTRAPPRSCNFIVMF